MSCGKCKGSGAMKTNLETKDGRSVLAVSGRVDSSNAHAFEKRVMELVSGGEDFALDMAGLEYISSGGLRVLLAAAKELRRKGRDLALCEVRDEVYKVLRLSGFTSFLSIHRCA